MNISIMEMKREFKQALEEIDFLERVKEISANSCADNRNIIEYYNKDKVREIFDQLGYVVKYYKKEKFFEITNEIRQYKLYCNISVDNGYLDIGWYLYEENKFFEGDVWQKLSRILNDEYESVMKPDFHNYEELKKVLKEVLVIYEDFKRKLFDILQ